VLGKNEGEDSDILNNPDNTVDEKEKCRARVAFRWVGLPGAPVGEAGRASLLDKTMDLCSARANTGSTEGEARDHLPVSFWIDLFLFCLQPSHTQLGFM
jgi:hypothetical protein